MDIENTVKIEVLDILNNVLKENNTIDIENLRKQFNLLKRNETKEYFDIKCLAKLKNGKRCSRRRRFNKYCSQHSKKNHYGNWTEKNTIEMSIEKRDNSVYFLDSNGKYYTNNIKNPTQVIINKFK